MFCLHFVRCEQKKNNLFSRCDDGAEQLKHCHLLQEEFQKFLIYSTLCCFVDIYRSKKSQNILCMSSCGCLWFYKKIMVFINNNNSIILEMWLFWLDFNLARGNKRWMFPAHGNNPLGTLLFIHNSRNIWPRLFLNFYLFFILKKDRIEVWNLVRIQVQIIVITNCLKNF